jgi:hypothetical protein
MASCSAAGNRIAFQALFSNTQIDINSLSEPDRENFHVRWRDWTPTSDKTKTECQDKGYYPRTVHEEVSRRSKPVVIAAVNPEGLS